MRPAITKMTAGFAKMNMIVPFFPPGGKCQAARDSGSQLRTASLLLGGAPPFGGGENQVHFFFQVGFTNGVSSLLVTPELRFETLRFDELTDGALWNSPVLSNADGPEFAVVDTGADGADGNTHALRCLLKRVEAIRVRWLRERGKDARQVLLQRSDGALLSKIANVLINAHAPSWCQSRDKWRHSFMTVVGSVRPFALRNLLTVTWLMPVSRIICRAEMPLAAIVSRTSRLISDRSRSGTDMAPVYAWVGPSVNLWRAVLCPRANLGSL